MERETVRIAQKGWLEKDDVINTRSLLQLADKSQ